MKLDRWIKPDSLENFFSLPNQIYSLGLEAGEITVYGYLRSLKNRETYQCWPSYRTIGKAVGMSKNTVKSMWQGWSTNGSSPQSLPRSSCATAASATAICATPSYPSSGQWTTSTNSSWQGWNWMWSSSG